MRWVGLFTEGLVIILLLAVFWFGDPTAYSWGASQGDFGSNSLDGSPSGERERLCTSGIADCDGGPVIHNLPGYETPTGWLALIGAIAFLALRRKADSRVSWAAVFITAVGMYLISLRYPDHAMVKAKYQISGHLSEEINGEFVYFVSIILGLIGLVGGLFRPSYRQQEPFDRVKEPPPADS